MISWTNVLQSGMTLCLFSCRFLVSLSLSLSRSFSCRSVRSCWPAILDTCAEQFAAGASKWWFHLSQVIGECPNALKIRGREKRMGR